MKRFRNNKDIPDQILIEGFLNGKSSDFDVLYERYKRQLYSYLNRLIPEQAALVDDIFQQTWIKIINQLPKYRNEQKFLAWTIRIAHNLAMDHFRRNKKLEVQVPMEEKHEMMFKDTREPWQNMDRQELSNALSRALKRLSPELAEVFLLRQDEVGFKEIAEIQNCSVNTALGRMQYALKNLRKLLNDKNLKNCSIK
jgi:RNA polymerase sigma-70 factor (ECF subfamily)